MRGGECFVNKSRALKSDGKLFVGSDAVARREKWRMFGDHCCGGKTEIALSILGVRFQIFNYECSFANCGPVNSILIRDDHASIKRRMRGENLSECFDPFMIDIVQKRGTNRGNNI